MRVASKLMHGARFCHLPSPSRPILFESGWNCNLKFGFLGQYDQKNYFSNYMDEKYGRAKNLSRLTYLDKVERTICTEVFRTKYLTGKHYKLFMLFSQVFSLRSFIWAFGWRNTDRNCICSSKTNKKKCDFLSFKRFYQRQFFTSVKWIFKKPILNLVSE